MAAASTSSRPERLHMNAQELLQEIVEFCRRTGLAESTFGRRAVNDGKLANRLRNGGRITTETLDRIRAFMDANRGTTAAVRPAVIPRPNEFHPMPAKSTSTHCESGRTPIRSAISAFSTTGKNICCS